MEIKFGIIKHDVCKFIGCYSQVLPLNEFRTLLKDLLKRALELYKLKHSKNALFAFIYSWWILKDFLQWIELCEEARVRQQVSTLPRPCVSKVDNYENDDDSECIKVFNTRLGSLIQL